jgi:hypothetical protein
LRPCGPRETLAHELLTSGGRDSFSFAGSFAGGLGVSRAQCRSIALARRTPPAVPRFAGWTTTFAAGKGGRSAFHHREWSASTTGRILRGGAKRSDRSRAR